MGRWAASVYDYEREEIADDDIADIDLQWGLWIQCRWCNGRKQRMLESFNHAPWKSHKCSVGHLHASPATASTVSTSQPTPTSKIPPRAIPRARERQHSPTTKKLLCEMVDLILEQQDDVHAMRDHITDLQSAVIGLKRELDDLRSRGHRLKGARVSHHPACCAGNTDVHESQDESSDVDDMFEDNIMN